MHIYAYAKLYIYEEIFAWKSPNNARNLLKKLDFDFAISLCILEAVLTETKPLSQQLQSAQTDMLEYSTQIKLTEKNVTEMRVDDKGFQKCFESATEISSALNIDIKMPRVAIIQ